MEIDFGQGSDGWNREGIGGPVFDSIAQEGDLLEHGEHGPLEDWLARGYRSCDGSVG